ncbi:uncharacterized protein LOC131658784 [Vicia villosa]|uniref:uncharacterized protein LOC131658784 n=1 Tax=Vicia villosa TaxID=3911 RepID=UPI00273B2C80|nr:uncharacterized protein LOC131658784 [Vicia villosa]
MGFQTFLSVKNTGYAGGIMVAYREDRLQISMISKEEQFIHLKVNNNLGDAWLLTVVYASPHERLKRLMWESIRKIAATINQPWLVVGYFNDIVCASEKKGGGQVSVHKCNVFRENMEDYYLLDLGASGPKFTWRGPIFHGGQRIFERLDRALSNEEWKLKFANCQVRVLTRVEFSDHHPIMITLNNNSFERCPKTFHFESA